MERGHVSTRIAVALGVVILALATLAASPGRNGAGDGAAARPIVLVGLDAADWLAIDPLVAAGKLPTFSRLKTLGRTGVMVSTPPLISPMIWTTIATGLDPENHGITDFMVDLPGGRQAPVGSSQRLAPAIWNLLSAAGRDVGVVGWWATWPAEHVRGIMVSDALAPQLTRQARRIDEGLVFPAAALNRVTRSVVRAESVTEDDLGVYSAPDVAGPERLRTLAGVIAATRTYERIADDLAGTERPDFLAVYFETIDSVSHLFVRERSGRQAIDRAYQVMDAAIGQLARASAPDALVFVCSDHGFYPPTAAISDDPANLTGPATAWHRPYGVVGVATAAALARGESSQQLRPADVGLITPLDVAPTLLHAAGVSVSSEMPGRVVAALLPAETAARPALRAVAPRFVAPSSDGLVRADADDTRQRLQALGYIGATGSSLGRQNLAESLFRRGKDAAAERELRAVIGAQPQNVAAQLWLAQILARTGRAGEALAVYAHAITLAGGAHDALIQAVDLAIANKDVAAARRMIAGVPGDPSFAHIARGAMAEAQGTPVLAEREYRAALDREPSSFDAAARLFDLLQRAGRGRDALEAIERAVRLAPDAPRLLALAGDARLASGDAAGAERALRGALARAPDADTVRIALGRALIASRKEAEAIQELRRVAPSPDRDVLLGAAYSSTKDWPNAIEHLQSAVHAGRTTPDVLNGLGWAQMQAGQRRDAAESFSRSLAAKPDQPEIRRLLKELGR
jgi:predicted AlkP superfamily phosphohydrolase/phosphomutase/predicted Zn-dependent protease